MSNYYPPQPPYPPPPQPHYYGYPPPPPPKKKKRRLLKVIIWTAVILVVVAVVGAIFSDDEIFSGGNESLLGQLHKPGETWSIYWYLCGTDLETGGGFASGDLAEFCSVTLPDNVQVVIETGGAYRWADPRIDADKLCRFLYRGNRLQLIEKAPMANMGSSGTFADFLRFCRENYPADHEAVILWDHGGGSVGGVICDERYDMDCMDLQDVRGALESVYKPNEKNPPLDLVGFDACLMATIETANALKDVARYMVASEEVEPGCGWDYAGLAQALADEPRLNAARLGKAICDSYAAGCNMVMSAGDITLSCVDLNRAGPLLAAWHNVGVEALAAACGNPNFFSVYGRGADAAEKYGPNDRASGFTGMVDMGDLVRCAADALPETAGAIEAALEECIVYRINGPYRMRNTGLACYYPLGPDTDELRKYVQISASQAHDYLYEYLITGQLSWEGAQYARSMQYIRVPSLDTPAPPKVQEFSRTSLPKAPSIAELDLEDFPVVLDDDNNSTLNLGSEIAEQLTGVYFNLACLDEDGDIILFLGRDNDLHADWENGVFKDNFWGDWGAIDGNFVYMDLTYESDEYDLYDVPILLNGEACSLRVAYVWETEEFEIIGARQGLDENSMPGKEVIQLQPGDEITTLHYVVQLSGDDDELHQVEIDTFTVTGETAFAYEEMGDGEFVFFFEMADARGETAYSQMVSFSVEDGEIYVDIN